MVYFKDPPLNWSDGTWLSLFRWLQKLQIMGSLYNEIWQVYNWKSLNVSISLSAAFGSMYIVTQDFLLNTVMPSISCVVAHRPPKQATCWCSPFFTHHICCLLSPAPFSPLVFYTYFDVKDRIIRLMSRQAWRHQSIGKKAKCDNLISHNQVTAAIQKNYISHYAVYTTTRIIWYLH